MYVIINLHVRRKERDINQTKIAENMDDPAVKPLQLSEPVLAKKKQACIRPHLELDNPEITKLLGQTFWINCSSKEQDWIYVRRGVILISTVAQVKHEDIVCKLKPITRVDDDRVRIGEEIPISGGDKIPTDFFSIKCKDRNGAIYENIHSAISPKTQTEHMQQDKDGLNVLLIGYDGLSRLLWHRLLPKSITFLTGDFGGIEMQGFNALRGGTKGALLGILTGKYLAELPETRKGFTDASHVDNYPWIWKELQEKNYVTQFGEDEPGMAAFNLRLRGFKDQPVDHYMRTYYLQAKEHYQNNPPGCLGAVPRHVRFMDWGREFYDTYSSIKKFSLLWFSELSHGECHNVRNADRDIVQFVKDMEESGYLDKTILIIASDHGPRFTEFRSSQQGKYEERLPFMVIRPPPMIYEHYPHIIENLRVNSQRLTTPLDLYETIKDATTMSNLDHIGSEEILSSRSISLFSRISRNRTCADADIWPHFCACLDWAKLDITDTRVGEIVGKLVDFMNNLLNQKLDICHSLSLDTIEKASLYKPPGIVLKSSDAVDYNDNITDFVDNLVATEIWYQVRITTSPNFAKYEATIKYKLQTNVVVIDNEDIDRINMYGNQPHCVSETLPQLAPYCYCKVQP